MPLTALILGGGGEGGEVLPFTAVKAEARCSPVLSLKKPVLINGACTMDGMVGWWGAGATQEGSLNDRVRGVMTSITQCRIAVTLAARSGLFLRKGNVSLRSGESYASGVVSLSYFGTGGFRAYRRIEGGFQRVLEWSIKQNAVKWFWRLSVDGVVSGSFPAAAQCSAVVQRVRGVRGWRQGEGALFGGRNAGEGAGI